jgi:hypothetical protein
MRLWMLLRPLGWQGSFLVPLLRSRARAGWAERFVRAGRSGSDSGRGAGGERLRTTAVAPRERHHQGERTDESHARAQERHISESFITSEPGGRNQYTLLSITSPRLRVPSWR